MNVDFSVFPTMCLQDTRAIHCEIVSQAMSFLLFAMVTFHNFFLLQRTWACTDNESEKTCTLEMSMLPIGSSNKR